MVDKEALMGQVIHVGYLVEPAVVASDLFGCSRGENNRV